MTPEDILVGLSDAQREAVRALLGPLLIKAGPGSGKTRTITHRIAYGVASNTYEPARTLAVTFTTRAAGELRRRLTSLGAGPVAVRTFHSAALRQLRYFWPEAVGGGMPRIEPQRQPLLAIAAEQVGAQADGDAVAQYLTELDWIKAGGIAAPDYLSNAQSRPQGIAAAEDVAKVLGAYEEVKTERGMLDFDDVLLITVGLLESRTDLRESVRRAFRWVTVDEYQDVSPLQQRLLDLWVGERGNLCVVGDPAQTIYQFAGADPGLIATFPRRYPRAQVVELDETYRCSPRIVAGANRLAASIPGSLQLRTLPGTARNAGSVQILQFPTEGSEAAGVAEEIAALIERGHPPGEIACVYRTHLGGRALADELRRRRIPFTLRGGERFWDRPEVKEAVTRFRAEARTAPGATAAEAMAAVLTAMGHQDEPPDSPAARNRWESLAALARLYPASAPVPAAYEVASFDGRVADDEPPPPAGVSLLTLHSAKGLEWDTVFLITATDQNLPFVRAQTPEAIGEERRLCYVGFTRARRRLVVTWARQGSRGRQEPSPFLNALQADSAVEVALDAVAPAVVDLRRADPFVDHAGEGRPPARCRMCGRSLVTGVERVLGRCQDCPSTADSAVLSALHRWRDDRACADGIPGHLVLTDAVLLAIAEQWPAGPGELSRIPGVRPDKLERFGADVLAILNDHPIMDAVAERPREPGTGA